MFSDRNILYIISALAAIEKINIYSKGLMSSTSFLQANNQMNFNASITLLVAIAEETKKIDRQLLATQSRIESQNIANMRKVLAHDCRA